MLILLGFIKLICHSKDRIVFARPPASLPAPSHAMLILDGQLPDGLPAFLPPDTVWIDLLDGDAAEIVVGSRGVSGYFVGFRADRLERGLSTDLVQTARLAIMERLPKI